MRSMTEAADRIVAEAAGWLVRLDHAPDAGTQAAWRRWHDADPRHAEVWRRFGRLRQAVPDGTRKPDRAAAQAVRAVNASQARRRTLKLLTAGAGLGLLGTVSYRQADRAGWLAAYRTAAGEQRTLSLSDETSLLMNTGTALDLRMRGQAIDVHLRAGEIMLEARAAPVALRVLTCNGEISSGQARLAVRLQDGSTRVAVEQGEARILTLAQRDARLAAGEVGSFTREHIAAETGWVGREFAWTQGVLIAEDMRLADFLAELSRYRSGLVRCDPAVSDLRVTGTFRVRETDRVLEALAATHGLKVAYHTRYWVSVSAA